MFKLKAKTSLNVIISLVGKQKYSLFYLFNVPFLQLLN